jgi:hypothetical protein
MFDRYCSVSCIISQSANDAIYINFMKKSVFVINQDILYLQHGCSYAFLSLSVVLFITIISPKLENFKNVESWEMILDSQGL